MDGKFVVLYSSNGSIFRQAAINNVTEHDSEEAAMEAVKNFKDPNVSKYAAPPTVVFRVARLIASVTTKPVIETVVTRY